MGLSGCGLLADGVFDTDARFGGRPTCVFDVVGEPGPAVSNEVPTRPAGLVWDGAALWTTPTSGAASLVALDPESGTTTAVLELPDTRWTRAEDLTLTPSDAAGGQSVWVVDQGLGTGGATGPVLVQIDVTVGSLPALVSVSTWPLQWPDGVRREVGSLWSDDRRLLLATRGESPATVWEADPGAGTLRQVATVATGTLDPTTLDAGDASTAWLAMRDVSWLNLWPRAVREPVEDALDQIPCTVPLRADEDGTLAIGDDALWTLPADGSLRRYPWPEVGGPSAPR